MDEENDTRPKNSPYASEIIALRFQSGPALSVPRALLQQSSTLSAQVPSDDSKEIHLADITYHVGHVIVHFLVSGAYQCLKPRGSNPTERHIAEFTTALRVYDASQSLSLMPLRDLARREITKLGDKLSLLSLISVMEGSHENFSCHPGIAAYVEYRTLKFGEMAALETAGEVLAELGTPSTLSKVLLKSMVLMKSTELARRYEISSGEDTPVSHDEVNYPFGDDIDRDTSVAAEKAMKEAEATAEAEALRAAEEARAACEQAELEHLRNKKAKGSKTAKQEKRRLGYLAESEARRAAAQEEAVGRREAEEAMATNTQQQQQADRGQATRICSAPGLVLFPFLSPQRSAENRLLQAFR